MSDSRVLLLPDHVPEAPAQVSIKTSLKGMDKEEGNDKWPKVLSSLILLGAFLAIVIPAGVHKELLPGGLDSPWVLYTLVGGVACCCFAFAGFALLAKRKQGAGLEVFLLSSLAFLTGGFCAYFLAGSLR